MFMYKPLHHWVQPPLRITLLTLALLSPWGSMPAHAQFGAASTVPTFKADSGFLKEEPYRKTKQVVKLTGVKSEAELITVRDAINDVVGFVRLFGITGSNLGNARISGTSPEQTAEIKAARVSWRAFEEQSTPKGRQSMPIEPASGHMVMAMDEWAVESDSALSVRTDFRQTSYELKMIKDPPARVYRLQFVKQRGVWLFDGASAVER
ncbi:MAG: hypothetical protein EBS47_02165 [Betaproteobacteria bacterium]|jgi:hypothetical protein|nr:hypothetical protein [Betaproteobacteria bacterium]NBT10473.1 hypothetical protein [Betaproteobacteria bacterium]NBU48903.1 hypothetical protein [Betaproteobacteria bacterium]NBX96112.1 hypothetical protein [Betaproteobacteria bacterium]